MNALAQVMRAAARVRFSLLGLATIKDIPTKRFKELIAALTDAGWRKTGEYQGFDAWIDYGQVSLKKGGVKLNLEWDNWTEGSVEGPRSTIEEMARQFDFPVSHAWRWSDYDDAQ
jgi:hypothetical protein